MAPLLRAVTAIFPVVLAGVLGNLATTPNISGWYAGLTKPGFTPPNWVFGPVWSVLYVSMAAALWRILSGRERPRPRSGADGVLRSARSTQPGRSRSSPPTARSRAPRDRALMAAILATIRLFWPLDRLAALLLVPYAAWVGYAAMLNFAVWRLNG